MDTHREAAPALRALLRDGELAGEWILDSRRSSIRLTNKVLGLLSVNGVFHEISGHGTVSADGQASGTVAAAATSVDTRNTRRDTHLRSAEIFDSGNHPQIVFTVDGIRPADRGVTVTGALTARGRTRPLSFDAVSTLPGDGEIQLDAEVRIDRTAFGLRWKGDGIAAKTTVLTIHAVFTRP
jgi:polyisoprenoid-binding protein YceI